MPKNNKSSKQAAKEVIAKPSSSSPSPPSHSNSSSSPPSGKFITSEEVYHRLKSDLAFNKTKGVISYWDAVKCRFIDVNLCQWRSIKEGGDVPWHRVHFVKYEQRVVWDREKRLCCIDQLRRELTGEDTVENEVDGEAENEAEGEGEDFSLGEVRVMSFNILSDVYDKQLTGSVERKQELISFIVSSLSNTPSQSSSSGEPCLPCHVLCLLEVEPDFLASLRLALSDQDNNNKDRKRSPGGSFSVISTDLPHNNIVLICRAPLSFSSFSLVSMGSPDKQAIVAHIPLHSLGAKGGNNGSVDNFSSEAWGACLTVAGVHLTSDSHGNADTKRTTQMQMLLSHLDSLPDSGADRSTIITGDFNSSSPIPLLSNFREVLLSAPTHDPLTNHFAKKLSKSQLPQKYTRLFYNGRLNSLSHSVLSKIVLSDHYPVQFEMEFFSGDGLEKEQYFNKQTVKRSAFTVVVPVNCWEKIARLHGETNKWMPHINIIFPMGFIDFETDPDLENDINKIISYFTSGKNGEIVVSIKEYDYFSHDGASFTLFGKLDSLSTRVFNQLYLDLSRRLGTDIGRFTPHLTFGKFEKEEDVMKFKRRPLDIEFPFRRVCFVSNVNDEFYQVMKVFGQRTISLQDLKPVIEHSCGSAEILVGGSALFDPSINLSLSSEVEESSKEENKIVNGVCDVEDNSKIGDIDLLVRGNISRDVFMNKFGRCLQTCGLVDLSSIERIKNLHTDHFTLAQDEDVGNNVSFDIHYCPQFSSHRTEEMTELDIASLSVYAASATLQKLGLKDFYLRLKQIKSFARSTRIYGHKFGYLSGISWSVLVAFFMRSMLKNDNNDIIQDQDNENNQNNQIV